MKNQELMLSNSPASSTFTVRDLLAMLFRHQRIAMVCFFGILVGTVLAVVFNPYKATIKFLVARERMDPIVTPDQNPAIARRADVTEEEINSEIELVKSEDVLRQVVLACGLYKHKSLSEYVFGPLAPEKKVEKAVRALQNGLKVDPVNKSNVITAVYTSDDPKRAAAVLKALGDAYIREHTAVRQAPGQVEFFDQEAQRYEKKIADAETQLKDFSGQQNGVAPSVSRDIVLQKLADFRSSLSQTQADLATAEQRIKSLEGQSQTTPQRLTTAMSKGDDAAVLQGYKNTLMSLQLRRTELLTKYQPDYPLVQEVDKQIADTQGAITAAEQKPIKQETTDRNPTYAWINEELAKARAEYSGLQAKETATQAIVASYEAQARDLERKGIAEQDLLRNLKTEQDNYTLYVHKREQARMTEALDNTHIVNVSIAQQPVIPSLPANSPALVAILGMLVAATVAMGAVFISEYLDPSFRTPAEVSAVLNVPLLAAVPYRLNGFHANGNGNGNSNGHGRSDTRPASDHPTIPMNS